MLTHTHRAEKTNPFRLPILFHYFNSERLLSSVRFLANFLGDVINATKTSSSNPREVKKETESVLSGSKNYGNSKASTRTLFFLLQLRKKIFYFPPKEEVLRLAPTLVWLTLSLNVGCVFFYFLNLSTVTTWVVAVCLHIHFHPFPKRTGSYCYRGYPKSQSSKRYPNSRLWYPGLPFLNLQMLCGRQLFLSLEQEADSEILAL